MIEIDGSYLEGGGQILRTAIALSAITGQSVDIFNIRKGRKKPGLRPQHLEGITTAAKICNAGVEGLKLNSMELAFTPGKIKGGSYKIDTKTAGSVTLILQTLIPLGTSTKLPLNLSIRGGTAVPYSPTIEYFRNIFCYYLSLMGVDVTLRLKKHGFYPVGGGHISVEIIPNKLKSIEILERGDSSKIEVLSVASEYLKSARVAERMIEGFKEIIPNANFTVEYVKTNSPGCFISATAYHSHNRIGSNALGKIGKKAEDVGKSAAIDLKKETESGAPIDSWMVDQIIPYMALATARTETKSNIKIPKLTKHAETNVWVVKKFLPVEFEIKDNAMVCFKPN